MKKTLLILIICSISFWTEGQAIEHVPADKSVVYFARPSSTRVFAIFTYYDGDKVIGQFTAPKYMRYECEPGEHIFWAKAENKSFIKANLAPGKIYLVEAVPIIGALTASVRLVPIDPKSSNIGRFRRLISGHQEQKQTKEKLASLNVRMKGSVKKGMGKLRALEKRNYKFARLSREMYVRPEDLVLPRKKKTKKKKRKG